MKTLGVGRFVFPETGDEAKTWQSFHQLRALATRVLCVAHTRIEGTWCAYCDAVPGENHDQEAEAVSRYGCKLPAAIAEQLFPLFKGIPYAD